jgi:hypothetical protein
MNVSQTALCNAALDLVPASTIISMNEQSYPAEVCRRQWPFALAELLERGNWTRLQKRVSMAVIANDRPCEWGVAYQAPIDLGSPIRVMPPQDATAAQDYLQVGQTAAYPNETQPGQGVPYVLSGSTIYANIGDGVLEYIPDDAATSLFTPLFNQALYTILASKLVMPLTKDRNRRLELSQEATLRIDQALASSGNLSGITYGNDIPPIIREMLS